MALVQDAERDEITKNKHIFETTKNFWLKLGMHNGSTNMYSIYDREIRTCPQIWKQKRKKILYFHTKMFFY